MKASMTNFDINAIVSELTQRIGNSELKNIFELNDIFFFRFRNKEYGRQVLVVEPGKRIHLTRFERDYPSSPSGLCKAFRIHIKKTWLKRVYQYDFDRVIVFELESFGKVYTLIIELFSKGNIILLSPQKRILVAKHYKKMRDRDIHPGVDFEFPPSSGRNFMEAKKEWVREQLLAKEKGGITRAISRTININGLYASEICLRAGVEPDKKAADITEEEVEQLLSAIDEVRAIAANKEIDPVKYYDDEGKIEDIVPFPLVSYKDYKKEETETFSKPLDEYYSTRETDKESEKELSVEAKKIQQIETIKKKQEDHLKQLQHTAEKDKEIGDLIYLHLNELEELLTTITKARRNKVEWPEIKEKMDMAKEKGMKGARLLKDIRENNKAVLVEIDDNTIQLDFLQSATDNATRYYERAKKAEGKIAGAQKKIAELAERIKKLEEGLIELEQKETVMIEKRDREWYEKFHWFKSSDGFLVLAGKDQRSNTMLVKRYLEKGDLFLHAELHGAAAVVIKAERKEVPQRTIDEAAIFSVCYSKAWKDGLSHEDTYWVNHDQVSFSAPSGEYLAKGSFIITGNKNQLRNIPLELAVCPVIEEKWAYVLCGPKTALETSDKGMKSKIITVIPGEVTKSQVAKKIVAKFLEGLNEADKEKIEATNLNELISHLPGDCYIKTDH